MKTSGPVIAGTDARLARQSGASGISERVTRCHLELQRDSMESDIRDEMVRLLPRLRRFAYSLTRDADRCNDLVQETCARALAKLDLWQPGTRFDSWMFRIAQNLWMDRMRAEKVQGEMVDVDAAHDIVGSDGRTVADGRFAMDDVARGIAQLSTDQQLVVALVCVDGMSYKAAAEVLNLPIGTVMSRLSRARLALHDFIYAEPDAGDPTGPEGRRGRVVR
jgi:RNA polymerase sigma-70 factor, ECF subfamily